MAAVIFAATSRSSNSRSRSSGRPLGEAGLLLDARPAKLTLVETHLAYAAVLQAAPRGRIARRAEPIAVWDRMELRR